MKIKNKKIVLLFFVLFIFLLLFFTSGGNTYGIYRDVLNTKVYLSVLDPNTSYEITLNTAGGTIENNVTSVSRTVNQPIGTLPTPTLANNNFLGWFYSNGDPVLADTLVTSDLTIIAHWAPIVCKKATQQNPLHTETCESDGPCRSAGYSNQNNVITYGTYPGANSPLPGDAYDCDVIGNGTYERFYFIRENTSNNNDNAVLIYYTSIDENGNKLLSSKSGASYKYVDNVNTPAPDVLPTSSMWGQTALKTFNEKVARFPSIADLEVACGASPIGASNGYLDSCQYFMENSRFQSAELGRAGIWVEPYNNSYYRMQTSSRVVQVPDNGAASENTVRPVIEIPYESLEGYQIKTQYRVRLDPQNGESVTYFFKYAGQAVGSLPTPTYTGYTFEGWYTDNINYTTQVTPSTVINSSVTFYAKWEAEVDRLEYVFHIPGTCTFNGNAAITSASNDCISTINHTNSNIDYTDNTNVDFAQTANKYIDTHVSLYNEDNYNMDYEVGFTIVAYNGSGSINTNNQATIFNAKLENQSENYPGLVFRRNGNANKLEISQTINGNRVNNANLSFTNPIQSSSPIDVKIVRKNGVISFSFDGYNNGELTDLYNNNNTSDYFEHYAWFGGAGSSVSRSATTSTATTGKYVKATLSNMYIKLDPGVTHNVTFNGEGGTVTPSSTIRVRDGKSIGASNLPTATKSSYYFDGWWTAASGGERITGNEIITTDDIEYHAQYKNIYYITFDAGQGGTLSIDPNDTIPVISGETIGTENMPTASKPGFQFIGWFSQANSGGTQYDGTEMISGDDTYYAQYKEIHTITFVVEQGATLSIAPDNSIDVLHGDSIGTSNMPTASKTGAIFIGWFSQANSGGTQYDGTEIINASDTYYAQFREIRTISFLTYGGRLSIDPATSIEVANGLSIGAENLPTAIKNGYSFDGWFSSENGGTQYDGTEIITADDTYHAHWTLLTGPTRTVTFKDNDNTTLGTRELIDGCFLENDMYPDPTKTNYIFNGWYINGNPMTPFTSETIVTGGDLTVIANWKETVTVATIVTNPSPLSIKLGTTGHIEVVPTAEDSVEAATFTSNDTNTISIGNNGTLYAEGTGTVTITITGAESGATRTIQATVHNSHTVTFDPDNGNNPTEILVPNGTSIGANAPSNPTKPDYIFDDWYLMDGNDFASPYEPLDTTKAVTHDITYKASWAGANDVAAIGRVYYESLALAFEEAPDNVETEVRVLQDISNITCTKNDTPDGCEKDGRTLVSSKKKIILLGGSHTITTGSNTVGNVIVVSGTLRIKSGTYISNKAGLAVLETNGSGKLYIDGGTITNTNNRGAVYNSGTLVVNGGNISTGSSVTIRPVLQSAGKTSKITINGGTITQNATSVNTSSGNDGRGAVAVTYTGNDCAAVITINGGTIISYATNSGAIRIPRGTLTIGTLNETYDATSPVIQGELWGVDSDVDYSVYDGIIKGKGNNNYQHAVNDTNLITGKEVGSTLVESTEGSYYTLYYTLASNNYRINYSTDGGTISADHSDFTVNTEITPGDLLTPTKSNHTFGGWYTDAGLNTAFTSITPQTSGSTTVYAKWTFNSSYTPVSFTTTSDAMTNYFSNISTWITTDATDPSNSDPDYDDRHALFKSSMNTNFTNNNCSECNEPNKCNNPGSGTYCDQPKEYDTGLSDSLNVYLYDDEAVDKKGTQVTYTTSSSGKIYNMIPGETYLWESSTNSSKYGVVTATGQRRTLKSSGVRNLRDLGGLSVSYTDLSTNQTVTGTIDYGRLYRGAQITSSAGVTDLTRLGVTREIDLRPDSEASSYYFNNFDIGTKSSHQDIFITNYHINPTATTYLPIETDPGDNCSSNHSDNYDNLKLALRKTMEYIIAGDNIFFHCTIGTDRTGTLAYFLEGLLGVSEEDRLRDYELTYYYGLTNRTRFHDYLEGSKINPRFESMYKSYPTNADIYAYYKYRTYTPGPGEYSDDELLTRFRNAVIIRNQ